ncbi:MAG: class I SAM-dependent DNA methyltransferase [Hyphomicrobiales bacterium]
MKKELFKYLKSISLIEPYSVNRLLVSAFLILNNIQFTKNKLLKNYIISTKNELEYKQLQEVIKLIKSNNEFGLEELTQLFEFVISPEDKVVTGAIYTPKNIREYIIENSLAVNNNISKDFKIADIACGCGSFLIDSAKRIKQDNKISYFEIFKKHIHGLDIQEYSITRTKLLLTLLALLENEDCKEFEFNLFVGNTLSFNWAEKLEGFKGFDIIIGNPPYVCSRNISTESKDLLRNWSVCNSGHPDLYIPFFQIGLENLSDKGILGYITMNTFFKSINGRALRDYFQKNQFAIKIIDFGNNQIFQSKSTYTCICFISKTSSSFIQVAQSDNLLKNIKYHKINYASINAYKGWNLIQNTIIDKIEKTGIPFGNLYKTRNGIATLKNNIYIFDPIDEDNDYYYLQNGQTYKIEKGICRNIINPNKFTRIKTVSSIKRKIIFPYEYHEKRVSLLDENYVKENYPKAYKYLLDKRNILFTRDKGKGKYLNWYAYGRNQSLEKLKYKLFFPHIAQTSPNFIINNDEDLLFYNGLAVITNSNKELKFLKKLMASKLFWLYIKYSSKPYGSGYYSLSKNYIKNFGVYNFSEDEKDFIIKTENKTEVDLFIEKKYGIEFNNNI